MFRVCVLHVAIHRVVGDAAIGKEVQAMVEACLRALECHARKGEWTAPLYRLARALWLDHGVSIREVEQARLRVDLEEPGRSPYEGPLEDAAQLQRIMHIYQS